MIEASARSRRIYDYVNELVTQALAMQGAAARMVQAADDDDEERVQLAAAHLLTHLRAFDDRLRRAIFGETAQIGAELTRLDPDARRALEALIEEWPR